MSCGSDWVKNLLSTCGFCPLRPWNWWMLHKCCTVSLYYISNHELLQRNHGQAVTLMHDSSNTTTIIITTYFHLEFFSPGLILNDLQILFSDTNIWSTQPFKRPKLSTFIDIFNRPQKQQIRESIQLHCTYQGFSDLLHIKKIFLFVDEHGPSIHIIIQMCVIIFWKMNSKYYCRLNCFSMKPFQLKWIKHFSDLGNTLNNIIYSKNYHYMVVNHVIALTPVAFYIVTVMEITTISPNVMT